jgi:hypothetical protein
MNYPMGTCTIKTFVEQQTNIEQCHPCLFPIELENPEDMPDEDYYIFDEEDLLN